MSGCRLGPKESYETKFKRCKAEVKKKNRGNKKYRKGAEFAICRKAIGKKYKGKKPRRVYSGKPGYKALVKKGARKCPGR